MGIYLVKNKDIFECNMIYINFIDNYYVVLVYYCIEVQGYSFYSLNTKVNNLIYICDLQLYTISIFICELFVLHLYHYY